MSIVSRIVEIRKSSVLDESVLQVPYMYIQKQFGYPVESILQTIHCEPLVHLGKYPNTFPYTIKEYYWISNKEPGTWYALGILENDLYFLYRAHCDTTFMNGKGSMYLWVSTRYETLIHFAMNEAIYQEYFNDTIG